MLLHQVVGRRRGLQHLLEEWLHAMQELWGWRHAHACVLTHQIVSVPWWQCALGVVQLFCVYEKGHA